MSRDMTLFVSNVSRKYDVDVLLSENAATICKWLLFTVFNQLIVVFGIVANVMNIICFVKLGFRDSVNVSLLGLAVADLCCLIPLVWSNICFTPAVSTSGLPFDPIELQYLVSGFLHTTFTRVSAWITAVITLERCLCVTAPLKVRQIITPRRIAVVIICIFVVLLSSVAPFYSVNLLGMKYFPSRNKTLLGLVYTSNREQVEQISFPINNVLITFGAFFVTVICTVKLVIRIREMSKWRESSVSNEQADKASKKNLKVARMVVMVSTLFIVCFVPLTVVITAIILEPDISFQGKQQNMIIVCIGCIFIIESINSSMNIFIYYHMSSKYKQIFLKLFCCIGCRLSAVD